MTIDRDGWIGKRAYALWEDAGRPEGMDREHWWRAVAEFDMMQKTRASSDGAEVLQFRTRPRQATRNVRVGQSTGTTGR